MRKQLLVIIIIILLVIVFSGCTFLGDLTGGALGPLSPREVKEHPNKYLDKTITVEGHYIGGGMISTVATPGSEAEAIEMLMNTLPIELINENITLVPSGKYQFTGVLKSKEVWNNVIVYLEVNKVKPV